MILPGGEPWCVVVGNGPSLRGFDLHRLTGPSVGMNAAYRHWDRIGWYPTYYCCLDDELIATHHDEIVRLVDRGQVRRAFVTGALLERHPERARDDRFLFLDSLLGYWHEVRGARFGLPRLDAPDFVSHAEDKLTTGSHAVRWAAHMGHRRIAMLGVDLNYVEVLPEAEATGPTSLRMARTPASNPNYFFDDYQRAGDRYNRPNPAEHAGALHVDAFRTLADDVAERTDLRLVNCNRRSRLFTDAILPFEPIDAVLGDTPLAAVATPAVLADADAVDTQLWMFEQDAFVPFASPPDHRPPALVYILNNQTARPVEDRVRARFDASPRLRQSFRALDFRYLDLEGERDAYVREVGSRSGRHGYKAGPNHQFFAAMRSLADEGLYSLYLEGDCLPLQPGWLGTLSRIVCQAEPFWVMGGHYRGIDMLPPAIRRHINGNAVYAAGDAGFQAFLTDTWEPGLHDILAEGDVRIAYDCVIENLFDPTGGRRGDESLWPRLQAVAHRFRLTGTIYNLGGDRDMQAPTPDLPARLVREAPETLMAHGKVFAAAAEALRRSGEPATLGGLILAPDGDGGDATVAASSTVWRSIGVVGGASEGDYGNVVVAVSRLRLGGAYWPEFVFKLHRSPGGAMIEFRRDDPAPRAFPSWTRDRDPDHVLVELRDGATLAPLEALLAPSDHPLARRVAGLIPTWLDIAEANAAEALAPWRPHWSTIASVCAGLAGDD